MTRAAVLNVTQTMDALRAHAALTTIIRLNKLLLKIICAPRSITCSYAFVCQLLCVIGQLALGNLQMILRIVQDNPPKEIITISMRPNDFQCLPTILGDSIASDDADTNTLRCHQIEEWLLHVLWRWSTGAPVGNLLPGG